MFRLIDDNESKVYYDVLPGVLPENYLNNEFSLLPIEIQHNISKYSSLRDRSLRIMGKILLNTIIKELNLDTEIELNNLKYTKNNKPYFNNKIDFSIAHSGQLSLCAVSLSNLVGVDVEEIKEVNYEEYEQFFCDEELQTLSISGFEKFYELWTKKESLAKATGEGILFPFKSVCVLDDSINYYGNLFRFIPLAVELGYKGYLCVGERYPNQY